MLEGLPRPVVAATPAAPVMADDPGRPYSGGSIAFAVFLTAFVPLGLFVALFVALSLLHGERSPVRRAQLRQWLWGIGALFAANGLLVYLLLVR